MLFLGASPSNAGDLVTKTYSDSGVQTLTNKTFTAPKINTIYDTNGAKVVDFTPNVSAVNFLNLANGATGTGVIVFADGTDSNVNLLLRSKGTGTINLSPGATNALQVVKSTTPVNYFRAYSSDTGVAAELNVTGSDTNVSMNLTTKGSGTVQANSVPVVTTTGTQTLTNKTLTSPTIDTPTLVTPKANSIFDATNNSQIFNLVGAAGGVNYIQAQNGAAGSGVVLLANGQDTNIGMNVDCRGVSAVSLRSQGTTILRAQPVTSAANYLQVSNSASGSPLLLTASGADANVGLSYQAKGSSTHSLTNSQGACFQTGNVASTVNYIYVAGAAAGNRPSVNATGSDTNIDLGLSGKGTGVVRANGVEVATISGTQTLTNKTISGASNTLSAIKSASVTLMTSIMRASGENIVFNPGFENGSFYLGTSAVYSTEQAHTGTYSAKVTGTGAGQWVYPFASETGSIRINANAGDTIYFECWVYGHAANTLSTSGFYLYSQTFNASGTLLENQFSGSVSASPSLSGVWTKFSGYRTFAHADTHSVNIGIYTNMPAGEVYYLDDPVVKFVTRSTAINQALYGANEPAATVLQSALPSTSVSTTGTQTLTNKTISGASNTITNIPYSALPAAHPLLLTETSSGVLTIPRLSVVDIASWAIESQLLNITYLYPQQNRTVSNLSIYFRTAGGVATTAQLGLYSVDGSGNLTLLQSTTNDTNLATSSWTTKTKALGASVDLVAGSVYAIVYLIDTTNSVGSVEGVSGRWDVLGIAPRMSGKITGHTSLPSFITAGSVLDASHALLIRAS